jgi:uncharacterized membrane protein
MIRRMSLGKIISMLIFCKEMTFTDTIIWSNNYRLLYILYGPIPIFAFLKPTVFTTVTKKKSIFTTIFKKIFTKKS